VAIPEIVAVMSQTWPLSQEANKSSGTCSVCLATRQLHIRDGTVHRHGPRNSPCPGSNLRLLETAPSAPTDGTRLSGTPSTDAPQADSIWSPTDSPLIKHIPKSSRSGCAAHLASLLRAATAQDEKAWLDLFSWGRTILLPPKRAGKRHNLASVIRSRISGFAPEHHPVQTAGCSRRPVSSSALLSQIITSKLEDGNIKAAVRILNSDENPSTPSEQTWTKLKDKHPAASKPLDGLPCPTQFASISVSELDVRRAALSFPTGSAGGPDGLRPQHIRDLLLSSVSGPELLSALTAFVNLVLAGGCPARVAPIFFGRRLLALDKDGGVRLIATGFTLRRLVSKCANSFGSERLRCYLCPRQLGVGVSGGCEAAVHSARRYLDSLPPGHIVVKLDFSNAFSSLHRSDMLNAVADRMPEIYAFCHSAYSQSSTLFNGPFCVSSQVGPQQGDPVGPLLFSNTVQPLLLSLESPLNLGYLDDFTLGGPAAVVAKDVSKIALVGGELGLSLNVSKCEVLSHDDFTVADSLLQSFLTTRIGDVTLLGAPLFPDPSLDKAWSDRCAELSRASSRLSQIGAQEALILLRGSFSAPKVLHLLRCSPSVSHPALPDFDRLLRSAVERITNSSLTDTQWLQARLPIKDGGLSVRHVSSLALPAFLASAAGTASLQAEILAYCDVPEDPYWKAYLELWSASGNDIPEPLPLKQSSWDRPGIEKDRTSIESGLTTILQRASFNAAISRHSGDWLQALPITCVCGVVD